MREYSVLMSVYAKEKKEFFEQSIDSMLQQTIPPKDFVIVCDGPLTEGLEEVLKRKQEENPELFQIVRIETCGGLGNALAKGIKYCKYDRVARMDSDDISVRERCEKQLRVFEKRNVSIVGGNITEFEGSIENEKNRRCVPEKNKEIRTFARRRNPFNHPSVMYKKADVLKAGNYRDRKGFEDYDLWVRMLKLGQRGYNIQETLVFMRTDAGMYARRGSFSYARQALKARWIIHRTGYSSLLDFLVSGVGQLVISLVPVKLRAAVYGRLLRKDTNV